MHQHFAIVFQLKFLSDLSNCPLDSTLLILIDDRDDMDENRNYSRLDAMGGAMN